MTTELRISRTMKTSLLVLTLLYFTLCIVAGLEIWRDLHQWAVHGFILLASILVLRQLFLLLSVSLHWLQPQPQWATDQPLPRISIIMPAYNEAATIQSALQSLLDIDYPDFEIIIVNDGSTDNTLLHIQSLLTQPTDIPIHLISQSNAGKANALNTGLLHAMGEFVLCVDADSRIHPQSLLHGIQHFANPQVGAIAGNVFVANEKQNLLTRLQQLEYLISQNFVRQGLAYWGIVTIIPGPVGLFRKQALASVAGYREDAQLFAEDADITVRLLAEGWQVKSDSQLFAQTEAPETVFALLRQRYRWKRGIYQVLHDNFYRLITAPKLRAPFIESLLIAEGFLLEILGFGITLFMIVNILYTASFNLLLAWLAVLFILDFLVLLIATPLRQLWKWLPLLVIQKLTYSYALQAWGIFSLLDEWRSTTMSWDKVERSGRLVATEVRS